MGEVMPTDQGDSSSGSVQPKLEPLIDGYDSTPDASSPEPEEEAPVQPSDAPPVVKRKGGRKPIYATSEERKQRNRQAQAAFRERRTEYIKQLEETIKQQETQLQSLQQSHRNAADECLMLRYKNSLLERLLLEKGIDVQAELRTKGGSGPSKPQATSSTSHVSPIQRAMMNRQQHVRVNSNSSTLARQNTAPSNNSPTFHATPSSQHSSPSTAKSPTGYVIQGGLTPATSDLQAQPQMQPPALQPQHPTQTATFINHNIQPQQRRRQHPSSSTNSYQTPSSTVSAASSGFYPTSFQKHYDQLEQEYAHDAQADIMVDVDTQGDGLDNLVDTPTEMSFPPNFTPQHPPPGIQSQPFHHQQQNPPHPQRGHPIHHQNQQTTPPAPVTVSADQQQQHNIFAHGPGHPLFDPFDPMLDADPFGLTASMHFPTPFSFEEATAPLQQQHEGQGNQGSSG